MEDFRAADEPAKHKVPPLLSDDNALHLEIKFTLHLRSIERTKEEVCLMERFSLDLAKRQHALLLQEQLKTLLDKGLNTDLVIITEEDSKENTFRVHRGILAARSPMFAGMLQSGMNEASAGVVRVKDVSPKAMQNVLSYIYSGETDDDLNWSNVGEVQELIYAADKYCLKGLRDYCDKMLFCGCEHENALQLLYLAQMHCLKVALNEISLYIKM